MKTPQTPATGEGWTVTDVLDRAADLIEPEGASTRGANARDKEGQATTSDSYSAVCFCMAGALMRSDRGAYRGSLVRTVLPAPENPEQDWLVAFNDAPGRTQAEVVAKLREAAAVARERGL